MPLTEKTGLSFQLSPEEGTFLVELARKAVEQYLKTRKCIDVPENLSEKLLQPCGVFVTINSISGGEKELRGCIGFPYPTLPLARAVIDSAMNAATQDPRFPPLSLGELEHVVFEVSVLTPPRLIEAKNPREYCTEITVGEDGLIVERGIYKGLLLPQVPVEWGWDAQEFLCQCCNKAGLLADYWLRQGTKIYKFNCIIAREITPKGSVEVISPKDVLKR
ncbi:MAG: TIGR00296 family protein [Candidatus Bathyarchaeia archaeon]